MPGGAPADGMLRYQASYDIMTITTPQNIVSQARLERVVGDDSMIVPPVDVIVDIINIHYPPPTNESIFYSVLGGEERDTSHSLYFLNRKYFGFFPQYKNIFSILI